jgi:hypothetical protein
MALNSFGGSFLTKLNELRMKIFDDQDGENENEYPFDDGWKCALF